MNILHVLVFAAMAAVVVSLVAGVLAMASDGPIGHRDSATWMNWRVGFQAVAVVLVMAGALAQA